MLSYLSRWEIGFSDIHYVRGTITYCKITNCLRNLIYDTPRYTFCIGIHLIFREAIETFPTANILIRPSASLEYLQSVHSADCYWSGLKVAATNRFWVGDINSQIMVLFVHKGLNALISTAVPSKSPCCFSDRLCLHEYFPVAVLPAAFFLHNHFLLLTCPPPSSFTPTLFTSFSNLISFFYIICQTPYLSPFSSIGFVHHLSTLLQFSNTYLPHHD